MKQKFTSALSLALIVAMLFTSVALADNVQDDVAVTYPNGVSLIAGDPQSSAPVGYYVHASNGNDGDPGCNLDGGAESLTLSINTPPGVSASPSSVTFVACEVDIFVTFTAAANAQSGAATVSITSNSSGNGTYNLSPASFQITVVAPPSNTAPTLTLPSNITAEATSAAGAAVSYSASATDAEDNPDPTPSCSAASGSTFGIGATTVTCSVTDSGGMSASGSFSVTVQDTTAPIIATHADVNAEATSGTGAVVSYTSPATSDAVDGTGTANCAPASGGTFALGNTTVTCNATDAHVNAAIATTFVVHVLDTVGPVLTLPTNITEEAVGPSGNVVTYSASATDAVDGAVPVSCAPASGSMFPIAATTVNCSATDAHGNPANGSFSVTIADTTAPVIATHLDQTVEATSADGAIVNYISPATSDAVDGAGTASCTSASGTQFALGNTTVTCAASDAAGNNATSTTFVVHVVDTTDPIITFANRTAANANGWNNGDVTVNWSCTDLVGVVLASVSETVSTEGANQSAIGTCEDTSGNTADDTQSAINIDTTPPSASASRAPAANGAGWNNSDVTVSFSGTDGLSGIDSCSANQVFGEGVNQSASGTCTDKAGNESGAATISNINVDKTAPTASASASPAANSNGWNKTDVTVSFSGSDSLSGIASCDANVVLSSEGAGQSASGTCTDQAGNVSNPATASGINIDKTNPTVSLVNGPVDGASYYFGFVPAAPTCSASDVLSGLDGSCSVAGYSTALGLHTVSASAADKAGNSASASATYTVLGWTFKGFYSPVDMSPNAPTTIVWNTVKGGSTVPLKFEVFAGSTNELTETSFIAATFAKQIACIGGTDDSVEVLATGGTSLRYDPTGIGQFIYNWQTPKKPGQCYQVTMTTLDGSSLSAFFKLK